jgi:ABC-type lipoprotein export system ATPase subunit
MMPRIDEEFSIGVIFGSSGSGKSTLLKRFGEDKELNGIPTTQ